MTVQQELHFVKKSTGMCVQHRNTSIYIFYITSIDTIDILINLNINITMYSMTNLSCD